MPVRGNQTSPLLWKLEECAHGRGDTEIPCGINFAINTYLVSQNLREEVSMDVDDEDGTQRPRKVNDYGIQIDYESLDDEEREVRALYILMISMY